MVQFLCEQFFEVLDRPGGTEGQVFDQLRQVSGTRTGKDARQHLSRLEQLVLETLIRLVEVPEQETEARYG
ncbi:MAG TPA: hypothetical protein VGF48_17200 [Thermoanaerobaculia bacterium]